MIELDLSTHVLLLNTSCALLALILPIQQS